MTLPYSHHSSASHRKTAHPLSVTSTAKMGFQPLTTIVSEAQAHQVWGKLLDKPLTSYIQNLLHFYEKQGQHLLSSGLHQGRHTWAQWLNGDIVLMEGLGSFQRIVEANPQSPEAWHFLAFFQWECGLKEPAQASAQEALRQSSLLNTQTRTLLATWRLGEHGVFNALWHYGLPLFIAEVLTPLRHSIGMNRLGSSFYIQTALIDGDETFSDEDFPDFMKSPRRVRPGQSTLSSDTVEFPLVSFKDKVFDTPEENEITALLNADHIDQAIDVLEARIALSPEAGETHFEVAKLYQNEGMFMKALYHLRMALNTMPHHAKSYYHMGEVLKSMNDIEGCIEAYKTAITFAVDPLWTAQVSRQLARIYEQDKGDMDHALACMQLAQELEPENINDLFMVAEAHCKHERYDAAVETYQKILQFQPENAEVYGFLGYLYWQANRYHEAENAYKKAIIFNQHNPIALNNLGVLYLDVWEDANEARTYFEQAKRLDGSYAMARFNLGRTFLKRGEPHLAKPFLEEALRLNHVSDELAPADLEALLRGLDL